MASKHIDQDALAGADENHAPATAADVELGILDGAKGTEKVPAKEISVPAGEEDENGKVYPPTRKVMVVMLALYLSLFLVSLVIFSELHLFQES